jgi:Lambda phage tail tape-measure protein (Tape_meas_lam_C)
MAVSAKVATAYIEFVAQTETFKKATSEAGRLVKETSGRMRADMAEAKGSIALLGEEFGVHLPRHLRTFVAELPGVSAAMSAAFDAVAVFVLIDVVIKAGEKLTEFIKKNEEAARKNREAWDESRQKLEMNNDALDLANMKLENQLAKLEHKPENRLAAALLEARVETEKLDEKLQAAIKDTQALLEKQSVGMWSLFTFKAATDYEQTMVAQHARWMTGAGTPEAKLGESKSFAASLDIRLNELLDMQKKQTAVGSLSFQPEIDAIHEMMRRQAIEQSFIAGSIQQTALQGKIAGYGGGGGTSDASNPFADIDRPNTSMFSTPIRNLARSLYAQLKADLAEAAQADQARAEIVAAGEWQPFESAQGNAAAGVFASRGPSVGYSPVAQLSPAAQGAVDALNQLSDSFTDTATMVRDVVIQSFNEFNKSMSEILTGDKRASFSKMFHSLADTGMQSGLKQLEGFGLKAFGFGGKKDGSSAAAALYVNVVNGMPGTAVPGGVINGLNDNNWFSGLFGGRLFGAGSIFGGGRALGGDVAAGVPIDVGELGRERFTPMVPGRITSSRDMRSAPTIGYIDARGTDPALTRENFARALQMTHARAVNDAAVAMSERMRRTPR